MLVPTKPEYTLFSLLHGRFGSEKQWEGLARSLSRRGFQVIAHRLRIEDPNITLDDHAEEIRKREQATRAKRVIRWSHSWGFNPMMRELHDAVVGLGTIAGSPAKGAEPQGFTADVQHTMSYEYMKKHPEEFQNEELLQFVFFNDIKNPRVLRRAISDLRWEHRCQDTPPLKTIETGRPLIYIATTRDMDILIESQRTLAEKLKAEIVELKGSGHFPMYTRVKELGNIATKFSEQLT